MLTRFLFLGALTLLAGCASHSVHNTNTRSMTSTAKEIRTPSSTFANEAFYNDGFDSTVAKQLGGAKLCRCNDVALKDRIGIASTTDNARTKNSTFEYKLGCGVRTSSENSKPDDQITTVSCSSFDLL